MEDKDVYPKEDHDSMKDKRKKRIKKKKKEKKI